jgi:hypothetical protein
MSASEERTMHPRVHNLLGQQFGRLTVIEQAASIPGGQARWRCRCQCGGETTIPGSNLRRGLVLSCGCLQHERARDASVTHAQCGLPEFNAWRGILRRCNNPKAIGYSDHGGRGIQCLWASFDEFVADVGERPSPGHRLFRLDRDGHFGPGNCAWMTPKEHYKQYASTYTNLRRRHQR